MATKGCKKLSGHLETMANIYTTTTLPSGNVAYNEFLTICHRAPTATAASKVV